MAIRVESKAFKAAPARRCGAIAEALLAIPACLNVFARVSESAIAIVAQRFRKHQIFDRQIWQAFHSLDIERKGKLRRSEVRDATVVTDWLSGSGAPPEFRLRSAVVAR